MPASWDRVLAAMEAEAARAAALLSDSTGIALDTTAPDPVDVPATWRLPDAPTSSSRHEFMTPPRADHAPAEITLPDPDEMPPLSAEHRARLEQLHERITTLRTELAQAMAEAEQILSRPARRAAEPATQAELVDRRV